MKSRRSLKNVIIQGIVIISLLIMIFSIGSAAELSQEEYSLHVEFIESIRNGEDIEVIRGYLEKGVDPNLDAFGHGHALRTAAWANSSPEVIKVLLDYGAEPTASDLGLFMVFECNLDNIKLLLESGVDVNGEISNSIFGPFISRDEHFVEEAKKENKLQVDIFRSLAFSPPLMVAVKAGRVELTELLIEYGADVHYKKLGESIIHSAAVNKEKPEIFKMLLHAGCNPEMIAGNTTPLIKAAEVGNLTVCRYLLNYGVDINKQYDYPGTNPLKAAVINNNVEVVELLIKNNADLTLRYKPHISRNILHIAAENNVDPKIAEMLVNNGLDPEAKTSSGKTAYDIAAAKNKNPLLIYKLHEMQNGSTQTSIDNSKNFQQYIKDLSGYKIYLSPDLKELLINNFSEDTAVISSWDIDEKDNPVFKWERKAETKDINSISADLSHYAYLETDSSKRPTYTLYIRRTRDGGLVNKIKLPFSGEFESSFEWNPHLAVNSDSMILSVLMEFKGFKNVAFSDESTKEKYDGEHHFYFYDIKSGDLIEEKNVCPYLETGLKGPADMTVSFDGKYITIEAAADMGWKAAEFMRVLRTDIPDFIFLTLDEEYLKNASWRFLREDGLIAGRNWEQNLIRIYDVNNKKKIKEIDTTAEEEIPVMYTQSSGISFNLNDLTFNELVVVGGKLDRSNTHVIDDERIHMIGYNEEKKEWVIIGRNKIHYISSNGDDFKEYLKGMEMIEYSFVEKGIEKVKEVLAGGLISSAARNNGRFLNPALELTLKQRAELVLAEYRSLLGIDEGMIIGSVNDDGAARVVNDDNLKYAHWKLIEYGMLAARAGYPEYTLQAADLLKELRKVYSGDLDWDRIDGEIVLLKGLGIAVRDGSEKAYNFMLDSGGILDDNGQNHVLGMYFNKYPQYFAPLLADKKKMAYFTKLAENELPSAQMWQPVKLDFMDLKGNKIEGIKKK